MRGLRSALRNVVLAHLGVERGTPQAQQRRGGLLVPARGLERFQDGRALDLLEGPRRYFGRRDGRAAALARRVLQRLGQVGERDFLAARYEDGALDGVLQLAHVARPRVGQEAAVRLRLDRVRAALVLGPI